MIKTYAWSKLGLLVTAATLLSACMDKELPKVEMTPDTIVIDGSSTVYPISKEAARRYMDEVDTAKIAVSFSGTNAGFERFCQGETSINDASRAINDQERALCQQNQVEFIELPLAKDALAIVVNPKNNWLTSLSVDDLKKIWSPDSEGKVMKWSDVRPEWPQESIKLFGRGQDSGTYDYFTTQVTGQTRVSRKDYTASEDEELLATEMAKDANSLGFFGIGAYHRHWDTLRLVAIDSGQGAIYPSIETASNGSYTPFTRPLYLYVSTKALAEQTQLKPFLEHYYANLNKWIHFTGYLPLSQTRYQQVLQSLQSGQSIQQSESQSDNPPVLASKTTF